jgi:hypothetical protein
MTKLTNEELRNFFSQVCAWQDNKCARQREGSSEFDCCINFNKNNPEICKKCHIDKNQYQPDICRLYLCRYITRKILSSKDEELKMLWHRFVEEREYLIGGVL